MLFKSLPTYKWGDIIKSEKKINVLLIGNPNCGKTTLFNRLTGSRQHTGNRAGVTVEAKTGVIKSNKNVSIRLTDLPGTYSLEPYTAEETIVKNILSNQRTDVIINITDVLNIERSLYLTTQLMQLGIPVVLAPNMLDLLEKSGGKFHADLLKNRIHLPIVPVSAVKGTGTEALIDEIIIAAHNKSVPQIQSFANARERYEFVGKISDKIVTGKTDYSKSITYKIDKILMNRFFALPIFLAVIFIMFLITFGDFGTSLRNNFESLITVFIGGKLNDFLTYINCDETLKSMINATLIKGVGSVLSFLPQTAMLFAMISMLEDSGYMSRAAFAADRFLRKLGISGKAFIPLVMGFGCTVPAVLSSRVLENPCERRITVMITPFMSCPAKMPVYLLLSSYFFAEYSAAVIFSLYLIGIIAAVITAKILNSAFGTKSSFIMELPPYRLPSLKSTAIHIRTRTKDFLIRAGTVIPLASGAIWFLQSFDLSLCKSAYENSMLFAIGNIMSPIFSVCGFGNPEAVVSLITGIAAREASASTLSVLTSGVGLDAVFTPLSAYSFMIFVLMCPPCIAALSAMHKELKSIKYLVMSVTYQLFTAWLISGCIYQFGTLIKIS